MNKYIYTKEMPAEKKADVLIAGGGPAGIAAGIAAARQGADTLLLEMSGCTGGMATSGLVGPFMTTWDAKGNTQIIRGIFDELVTRMEEKGGAIHPEKVRDGTTYCSFSKIGHDHVAPFKPEILKVVAEEMLLKAGCRLQYYSHCIDVVREGSSLKGIIVNSKSGTELISGKVIIDCTGDADLAFLAGVPCVLGSEDEGRMQPASLFFRIYNVDSDKVQSEIEKNRYRIGMVDGKYMGTFNWIISEARKTGEWDIDRLSIGMYEGPVKGEWSINCSRVTDIDGTDVNDLTEGTIEGRRQVEKIFNFIKKNIPGYENSKLMDSAAVLGIRETRHIKGEYTMTSEDVLDAKVPDDSIVLAANALDDHGKGDKSAGEYKTLESGDYYGISYRVLLPQEVDNLLVAGRSVSATAGGASAIRVMPPCLGMGQAAGTAAVMALNSGQLPRELDVKLLQQSLVEQGAYLNL
ncbi:MAG: FAD-dependent oxidoreductase [Planctomycetota bacterium]|jgi:hypothetical protein